MLRNFLLKSSCFLLFYLLSSCSTTEYQKCYCPQIKNTCPNAANQSSDDISPESQKLSPTQTIELASKLFNNGEPEEALKIINDIPERSQDSQYKTLRRDIINKIVINTRYKVRVLYEKSLQNNGNTKRELLLQCKNMLEYTIKNYSDYEDIYAIKNNLKQIERELAKK